MFNFNKTIPLIVFDLIVIPISFVFKSIRFIFGVVLWTPIVLISFFFRIIFPIIGAAVFICIPIAVICIPIVFVVDVLNDEREDNSEYDYDFNYDTSIDIENNPGIHWVDSYTKSDGTEVRGHDRSNPDGDRSNNLNSK